MIKKNFDLHVRKVVQNINLSIYPTKTVPIQKHFNFVAIKIITQVEKMAELIFLTQV
jgi:hypothetical protein